jgi:hypothetical protein
LLTTDDAQQRALATTVQANNANTVAIAQSDRDIGEQRTIGSRRFESLGIDHNHDCSGYEHFPTEFWKRHNY